MGVVKSNMLKSWGDYRTKPVLYKNKKIKLRKYIVVNALVMKQINKPEWRGVDHYLNYKKAVCYYGLSGLKYYEERFYKGVPLPSERGFFQGIYYKIKDALQVLKLRIFKK